MRASQKRNAGLSPERRIQFRMGIHLGDVVEESDGDLMGDGINIAARLEGIAEAGTLSNWRGQAATDHRTFLAQRQRIYEGMRKAGYRSDICLRREAGGPTIWLPTGVVNFVADRLAVTENHC